MGTTADEVGGAMNTSTIAVRARQRGHVNTNPMETLPCRRQADKRKKLPADRKREQNSKEESDHSKARQNPIRPLVSRVAAGGKWGGAGRGATLEIKEGS